MKKRLLTLVAFLALSMISFAQGPYWNIQVSGFSTPSRGIQSMDAVDANVVWASAYDGTAPTAACQDITRTVNGGNTWTAGTVSGATGMALAMIDGVNDQKAWVIAYNPSGSATPNDGVWATTDGGSTWTHQTTAAFSGSASFPDCIHFFNANEGWCMGDPINGEFEIYTTSDGGTTWTLVPGTQIANPGSGEWGVVGYTSSIGDTSWFGTNKGRIYKSVDKGHNWTAAQIPGWEAIYTTPIFRDGMHGIAQDRSTTSVPSGPLTGALAESSDGGATWTLISGLPTNVFSNDLDAVPGTPNTYVATGADINNSVSGVMYSFDGGHTWTIMTDSETVQFLAGAWVDSQTGWAGSFNTDATSDGMYKFNSNLVESIPDFETADTALAFGGSATFTNLSTNASTYLWTFEGGTPSTSTLQNPPAIQYTQGGQYDVTLKVTGPFTPSKTITKTNYIRVGFLGIGDKSQATVTVFPNPATDIVNINANSNINTVNVYNLVGQLVFSQKVNNSHASVNVNNLPSGVYNIEAIFADGKFNSRIVVK